MKYSITTVAIAILGLTAQEVAGRGGNSGVGPGNVVDQAAENGVQGGLNPQPGVQQDGNGTGQSLKPLPGTPLTNPGKLIPLPTAAASSFDPSSFLATQSQTETTGATTALLTAITTPGEPIASFTSIPGLSSSKAKTSKLETSAATTIPLVPLGTGVSSANQGASLIPGFKTFSSSAAATVNPSVPLGTAGSSANKDGSNAISSPATFPLTNGTTRAGGKSSGSGGLAPLAPIGTGAGAIAGVSSFSSIEVIRTTKANGKVTSASVGVVETTAADGTIQTTSVPIPNAAEAVATASLQPLPGSAVVASGSLKPLPSATTGADTATGTLASLSGSTATGSGSSASTLLTSIMSANATGTAAKSGSTTLSGTTAQSGTVGTNSSAAGLTVTKMALSGVVGVMVAMLL